MEYTTLGKTGLKVSVAGLGCGGFSRLGIPHGKTEDEAARLIHEAVDLGINLLDTAPVYGTEAVVGKALKSIPRDSVVVATKALVYRNKEWHTPERVVASLDNSLRLMGTDYVDVFQLHGIMPGEEYRYSLETLGPALLEQKAKGKIRHIGMTEQPVEDFTHETLVRAAQDDIWEVFMVAFHMMHQSARKNLFPLTRQKRIGTMLMFAVRSIFAKPERVVAALREAAAQGKIDKSIARARRAARLSHSRQRRGQHHRSRVSLCAPRARRRCGAVRHRRPRASAHERRLAAQAAVARGGPGQACGAVRATDRRRNGFRADADEIPNFSVRCRASAGLAFSTPACVSAAPTCCMRLINSTAAIGVSTMRCAGCRRPVTGAFCLTSSSRVTPNSIRSDWPSK